MGTGFIRRFTQDPGLNTILEIEGVVVIDREPPAALVGLGTGATCCVGEFEDGPFAAEDGPVELFSGTDFLTTFGGFGFSYGGLSGQNPCARSRVADSAVDPEFWNGNGFISLASKKFSRLFVARADTSVGSVQLERLPSLTGNSDFTWALADGDSLAVAIDDAVSFAVFSATAATLTSIAGTYPTTFAGGESMNVTIDLGTPDQIGPVDIVFQSGDQSRAQVVSRINAVLGYTAAATVSSAQIAITGRIAGTGGRVTVNSVSGALVSTATGFAGADTIGGSGNVNDISRVTLPEAKNVIETAVPNSRVERDDNQSIRIVAISGELILIAAVGQTAIDKFGFPNPSPLSAVSSKTGVAEFVSGDITNPSTFGGGETLTIGIDGGQDVVVTFQSGDQTQAEVASRINLALGYEAVTAFSSTRDMFKGRKNGGQIRIVAVSGPSVLAALGIAGVLSVQAVAISNLVISAGFRVRDSAGAEWVTMQTVPSPPSDPGPYDVKVRPALDDGSATGASSGAVTIMPSGIPGLALSCTNLSALSAALSEAAIDATYQDAMDATLSQNAVTRDANIIFAARQSNAVRVGLRANAPSASFNMRGRVAVIRPPLGTDKRVAEGSVAPGVGSYRNDRTFYAFPGTQLFVPQIARLGLAGGAGFTADGVIDVGMDSWVASLESQLPPEQDIGQLTDILLPLLGVESGNSSVQTLSMDDYIAFRRLGIVGFRMADGTPIVQSDVTTVDGESSPNLVDGFRRRFADFAQDSIAKRCNGFVKKPMTRSNRIAIFGEIEGFLNSLLSPNLPESSRIFAYSIDAKSGNPQSQLDAGIFRLIIKIKMNPNILDIVLDTTIGTTVQIQQAA